MKLTRYALILMSAWGCNPAHAERSNYAADLDRLMQIDFEHLNHHYVHLCDQNLKAIRIVQDGNGNVLDWIELDPTYCDGLTPGEGFDVVDPISGRPW